MKHCPLSLFILTLAVLGCEQDDPFDFNLPGDLPGGQ